MNIRLFCDCYVSLVDDSHHSRLDELSHRAVERVHRDLSLSERPQQRRRPLSGLRLVSAFRDCVHKLLPRGLSRDVERVAELARPSLARARARCTSRSRRSARTALLLRELEHVQRGEYVAGVVEIELADAQKTEVSADRGKAPELGKEKELVADLDDHAVVRGVVLGLEESAREAGVD